MMASLLQKVKKQRSDRRSKKMANKKSKNKKSKSKSRSSRDFSSGIRRSVEKIPLVGDIIKNPTVKKAAAAVGTVTILTSLASLIPNARVQAAAQNPTIKALSAFAIGDIPGAALQIATDRNLLGQIGGNNQMMVQPGMAGSA